MYLHTNQKSFRRFYRLLIKRHIYGITSPLRVLPDFLVIGPGRTGTTSLYNYLNEHPSIVKSAYDELGFFDVNYHLGFNWYRSLFPTIFTKYKIKSETNFFMTYDVTPSYVRRPWVAKRIAQYFPTIKLIVVLRNPVDKTYSHYNLGKKTHNENRSFENVIQEDMKNISKWDDKKDYHYFATRVEKSYLARGFYAEQLYPWFESFSKEQIKIISSENLANNTQETLQEIFQFLKLPKYAIKNTEKVNVSNYLPMKDDTRKLLVNFFKPYNQQLYELINHKFDWDK